MNRPPASVTITAKTGPGVQNTAIVFSDVTDFEVDFIGNRLKITHGETITYYEYADIATLTWTISSGATAIVVSE